MAAQIAQEDRKGSSAGAAIRESRRHLPVLDGLLVEKIRSRCKARFPRHWHVE